MNWAVGDRCVFTAPFTPEVPYPVCRQLADGRWHSFDMVDNHLLTGRRGEIVEVSDVGLVVVRFFATTTAPEIAVSCDQHSDLRRLNLIEKIGDLDGG